jgi:hypothetical protein
MQALAPNLAAVLAPDYPKADQALAALLGRSQQPRAA